MIEIKDDDRLVILPPYVEPEHRPVIDQAEQILADYEEMLISKIKGDFDKSYGSIQPDPVHIRMLERGFYEDPMRLHLAKSLAKMKVIYEKPRFMIKAK